MSFSPVWTGVHPPLFQQQALALARDLSRCTANELSQMFSCSPDIGEQNRQRFEIFSSDEAEIMPTVLAYWGQAYKHLRADLMETAGRSGERHYRGYCATKA